MFTVPTSTHYALSDTIMDISQEQLHNEIRSSHRSLSASIGGPARPQTVPGVDELRDFHMKSLGKASDDLHFVEAFFSLRLVSNLSSHDLDPFAHAWTSLSDQGVGKVDIALKEKQLYEEIDPDGAIQYHMNPLAVRDEDEHDERFRQYDQANIFLKDIEEKRRYIQDGTIQIPLGDFVPEDETLVSDFSQFTMFFPSATTPATSSGKITGKNHPTQFVFDELYPADASMHFQVHSNIGNSEGKMSYALTGTGTVTLAEIGARVRTFLANNTDDSELEPIEIPLILNAVSAQDPDAKIVDHVSLPDKRGESMEPSTRGEALYEGSLFLYVHLADPATRVFFGEQLKFDNPRVDDVTKGNFSHVAASMRMHVMRDMFPFIDKFTKGMATVTEKDASGKVIRTRGWTFDPSLPEGKNIHAPFNKGNMHTLPGFTYYHDRAMQRLPTAPFVLNVARIVLERRGMTEKEFIEYAKNPVIVLDEQPDDLSPPGRERKGKKRLVINPGFVRALRILGEIATAFPTSMSYRGDYADLNTDAISNYEEILSDSDKFHHAEHASGMTRRSAGTGSHTRYFRHSGKPWQEALKVGTEAFGDGMMDRSGDCEDFAKLITRMLAGMYSTKSKHPTIISIQSMLHRYVPFANLSSVTSASIRTAPSDDDSEGSGGTSEQIGAVIVGSRKDLNAPIGAHMFSSLLNKQEVLKGIQRTSSRVEHLPDGTRLSEADQMEIAENVLHKSMWRISSDTKENVETSSSSIGESFSTDEDSTMNGVSRVEMEEFVREWTPPLILEGTGQSNALVNAVSSYYHTLEDKKSSINETLLHVEAITRLISGKPTSSVTAKDIKENQRVFGVFIMPIENNRLIDSSPDVRISPFYRMITEMYGIPEGMTDVRVTPHNLARSQILYNRSVENALDMTTGPLETNAELELALYGTGRNDEEESIYDIDRIIPVQLSRRALAGEEVKHDVENTERHLTYGINLTDFAHASDNVGIIRMVKTLPTEQRIVNNVMRHAAPSMALQLPPRAEVTKARKLAERYEAMLMENISDVVTRERYEEIPDKPVPLYTRVDWVRDRHIEDLAKVLSNNMYTERVTVRVESFARGHHLLRITPYMIVTGTKQLYLDSNVLSERMTSQDRMDAMLQKQLQDLLGQ